MKGFFEDALPLARDETSTHGSLRPLLPKKGWEPLKGPLRAKCSKPSPSLLLAKRCPVPGCKIPDCKLRTHLQYRHKSTPPSTSSDASVTTTSDDANRQGGQVSRVSGLDTKLNTDFSPPGVPFNTFHGLEALPDCVGDTPVFRRLFHEFFSRTYDRIRTLLSPPPFDPSRKQACIALAMTSPAYCLNALASVENEEVMRKTDVGRGPIGAMLYGEVMSILRKQVAHLDTAEIDNLLMIICTLAVFEIVHNNVSNLDLHRKGMVQLINKVGGVHNLNLSFPIVLNLDRIIAIYSGELPEFAQMIDRSIQKPSKYPEVYGSFFDTQGRVIIDRDICDFCCDVSRVMEVFEGAKISYDPTMAKEIRDNDVFYFYFSRQRVADHFTILHHRYWSQLSRGRCVLLATKILDYVILVDNYINVIPEFLASKIKETLDWMEADDQDTWKGQRDLLIWVLFVLVTVPQPPRTNKWALKPLKEMMATKYHNFSSESWAKEELESMKRFVWCNSRLDMPFLEVCSRLAGSCSIEKISRRRIVDQMADTNSDTEML